MLQKEELAKWKLEEIYGGGLFIKRALRNQKEKQTLHHNTPATCPRLQHINLSLHSGQKRKKVDDADGTAQSS